MDIFRKEPPVSIGGFILTVISFIIHLIGFASPFWNYISKPDFTLYYELWQYCFSEDEQTTCKSLTCDDGMDNPWCTSSWKATHVLEIFGLLSLFVAVVMVSLQMFKFKDRTILKLAGICCCFIAGVFIMIGVIVYGTQEDIDQHSSFHFAYAICIFAALGSVIAAILLIIGHKLAGNAAAKRTDKGPSLDPIEQNTSNDESDNEDQIGLRELDENGKSVANELKDNIDKEGLESVLEHLNEKLDNWRNEPVKLALTGKSGVGKSSFINAIRNLKPGDRGFATASGSGNTTKHATVYKYPGNANITLHDLPGFGTNEFSKYEYEERMELHKYDYFLIFVGNIEENDTELAKKLKTIEKPFCFVRSKLDIDIANAKNDGESEGEAIEKIMSKSLSILEQTSLKEARFFVISNRSRSIGHFDELVSYILSKLPELKCDAVMFSLLGELTNGIIDVKYEILEKRILKVSFASAGVSAMPIPGVDVVLNVALICKEILLYHNTFGFGQKIVIDISKDEYLRKKLSASSIIEIADASDAMRTFVILQLGKLGTLMAVQSAFDYIFPLIGSVVSGLTAGTVTYKLLTRILKGCRDDSKLVYSHLMKVNAQK